MADPPWSQFLMNSFLSTVRESPASESAHTHPTCICSITFFLLMDPLRYGCNSLPTTKSSLFTVELNKHLALFIQAMEPESFRLDSKHQEADWRMRERFSDLHHDVVTPTLSGISATRTRLLFYQYDKAANPFMPLAIAADLNIMNDAAL